MELMKLLSQTHELQHPSAIDGIVKDTKSNTSIREPTVSRRGVTALLQHFDDLNRNWKRTYGHLQNGMPAEELMVPC